MIVDCNRFLKLFEYQYTNIGQSRVSGVFMMALSTSSMFLLGVYHGNYYSFIHLLKITFYCGPE